MKILQKITTTRAAIDSIDTRIVQLLNHRARLAQRIGGLKRQAGLKIFDAHREKSVFKNLAGSHTGPFDLSIIQNVFRQILPAMRHMQIDRKPKIKFKRVGIVGLGLMGGSIARDLLDRGITRHVVGFDANTRSLAHAKKNGFIQSVGDSNFSWLKMCDLVILALPVLSIERVLPHIASIIGSHTLVIDVGSAKQGIVRTALRCFHAGNFVGCHPLAGSEKSGVGASAVRLFEGKKCFVTPTKSSKKPFIKKTKLFWESLGSDVLLVDAKKHDCCMAATSHLPQVLSTLLAQVALGAHGNKDVKKYLGSGFDSMTRLAGSDSHMWADILMSNRMFVVPLLKKFQTLLVNLEQAIQRNQTKSVQRIFERSKELQRGIQK